MILTLDIGNRRLKWGCWQGSAFAASGSINWHDAPGLEPLADACGAAPHRVLACNVAGPEVAARLQRLCQQRWALAPEYLVSQASAAGVTCGYADPRELGPDRWAALLGLHQLALGDACVVDCGTAVTLDVLRADGRHLGGAIAPGLTTMRASLSRQTHRLGDASDTPALLAARTADAIAGGTLYALAGGVERLLAEARRASRLPLRCVLTGGDAALVQGLLPGETELHPHLVLRGVLVGLAQ